MTNPSSSLQSRACPERASNQASRRARQAWTIAKIELRRVFFAKRSFWIYGLALLPSLMFFGHGLDMKLDGRRLARNGLTAPALIDSVRDGESVEDVKKRLGKPAEEYSGMRVRRVRQAHRECRDDDPRHRAGGRRPLRPPECHPPSYSGEPVARIYEFEVYGPDGRVNLALNRPVTGSAPCSEDQGPEKAVNGSVAGGQADRWCS